MDYRGWWKGTGHQSDSYTDVMLEWPDVKVASKLCIGGPCKYVLKEGSGLSDNWLIENVAPHIAEVYGAQVVAILAKPLLWALFQDVTTDSEHVPPSIRFRVMTAYNNLPGRLPNDENPIKKMQLIAWCEDATIHLDEVPEEFAQMQGVQAAPGNVRDDRLLAVYAGVSSMNRKQDDFINEYRQNRAETNRRLTSLESNVNQIALQPVQ